MLWIPCRNQLNYLALPQAIFVRCFFKAMRWGTNAANATVLNVGNTTGLLAYSLRTSRIITAEPGRCHCMGSQGFYFFPLLLQSHPQLAKWPLPTFLAAVHHFHMTYLRAQILHESLNIYSGLLCVFTYYVFKDQIQFELSNSYKRKVYFTSLHSH